MNRAHHIEEQAARWLMRREEDSFTAAEAEEFDAWLEESPGHKAAFWRIEEGWRRADRIAALRMPSQWLRSPWRSALRSYWAPTAIAASLALVAITGVWQTSSLSPEPQGQTIATMVGGHKIVPLDDGSQIELNTATVLRASVTDKSREVWLEHGEAYFDVRHSETVPFIVHAGLKTVSVMGTKFSVKREGDKVTVAVLEGRVRVTDAAEPKRGGASDIVAGSLAVTEPNAVLVTEAAPIEVQSELAWRDGTLIFQNDTLAEAAAEFNRYNKKKLLVSGEAARLRIGGSFKAKNVDGFVRLLHDAYGLDVRSTDKGVQISS